MWEDLIRGRLLSELTASKVLVSVLDLLIVAILFYQVFRLISGTRAMSLIKGLLVIFVARLLSIAVGLETLSWLLEKATTAVFVALPIVFQPELRRALEELGRGQFIADVFGTSRDELKRVAGMVADAAQSLSRKRIGALIVICGGIGLDDIVETGIRLDSLVSSELLQNIFIPNTPLHDGAVIISGGRVLGAACVLPLSENSKLSRDLGTRHRAGVGISEHSDAVSIIVSEETGTVSIAKNGKLERCERPDEVSDKLRRTLFVQPGRNNKFARFLRR